MFVILNIRAPQPRAQFHAIAEDHEAAYKNARYIQFWHQNEDASLTLDITPEFHNSDRFVIFHSSVPFAELCEQLETSAFNDPDNYHDIQHNCAHAAAFALKKAGILGTADVPARGLSPLALYEIAKNSKIKSHDEGTLCSSF